MLLQIITMSVFSDNIRFLRGKKEITQQDLADTLIITRSRYVSYEDGRSEPPIEVLVKISKFFNISIDLLVSVDIRKYPLDEILRLPDNRIVLPVVVDKLGNNSIEIIPQKASMGYLSGYSDPEYIENIDDLKENRSYVFVTLNDGISYKRFKSKNEKAVTVAADNSFYKPYEIPFHEIIEIWQYASGIFPEDFEPDHFENHNLKDMFLELRKDIRNLNIKISGLEEKQNSIG